MHRLLLPVLPVQELPSEQVLLPVQVQLPEPVLPVLLPVLLLRLLLLQLHMLHHLR